MKSANEIKESTVKSIETRPIIINHTKVQQAIDVIEECIVSASERGQFKVTIPMPPIQLLNKDELLKVTNTISDFGYSVTTTDNREWIVSWE
jgi:hypothetical protein